VIQESTSDPFLFSLAIGDTAHIGRVDFAGGMKVRCS
jgi:hypothetical protein